MSTEEKKHAMYYDLACLKGQKKHPILLARFEEHLEAYLEGLRAEHVRLVESLQSNVALYQDAYENQKTLTRNALVFSREHWDELHLLREDLAVSKYLYEQELALRQQDAAKIASGSQSIRALLRVVKSQQNACARLQRGLDESVAIINRDKSAHADIMNWFTAQYDELWEANQEKHKLVVSQRKRIESLESELLLSKKPAKRHGFWLFWMRKSTKAKLLPKKTN